MNTRKIAQLRDEAIVMALNEVSEYNKQTDIVVDDIVECAAEHSVWEVISEVDTENLTLTQLEIMLIPMVKRGIVAQM